MLIHILWFFFHRVVSQKEGKLRVLHWLGRYHEGYFSNGFLHGWGVYELSDNITLEGLWCRSIYTKGNIIIRDDDKHVREVM